MRLPEQLGLRVELGADCELALVRTGRRCRPAPEPLDPLLSSPHAATPTTRRSARSAPNRRRVVRGMSLSREGLWRRTLPFRIAGGTEAMSGTSSATTAADCGTRRSPTPHRADRTGRLPCRCRSLLGVWAADRRARLESPSASAGVLITVPSYALFGLLVAPFGIGTKPTVIALALYSVLPSCGTPSSASSPYQPPRWRLRAGWA